MSIYLDTSVVVPFFSADPFVSRARNFLRSLPLGLTVSDFVAAEFAAAVGRRVRMRQLSPDEARLVLADFDIWTAQATVRIETLPADIRAAEAILRRLGLTLRTPDAIHLATALRIGAELATFDTRMAENARLLGLALASV